MTWYLDFYALLVRWAVESAAVLLAASVAVALVRQPVRKLRVIEWSFVACLLLPGLAMFDMAPRWSFAWLRAAKPAEESFHRPKTGPAGGTPAQTPQAGGTPAARVGTTPDRAKGNRQATREFTQVPGVPAPPRQAVAATADSAGFGWRKHGDPRLIIVVGYLSGVAVMAAWWVAGFFALVRLLRRSAPADERCRAALHDIAGDAATRARLLVSRLEAQPFACSWWRPAIVLPQRLAAGDADALKCALAHEWSHVARGDTWWWSLAGVVRLVCFYQPLVWWLRSQMRLAQDYLADADAAGQAPAAEDYAQFLANWAASNVRRPLYGGLGILGRRSDLYRRVIMLVQNPQPLDRRCPRRWDVGVVTSLAMIVALATTYGGADDAQPPHSTRRAADDDRPRKSKVNQTEQEPPRVPAVRPPEQARLDKLVDGILVRARAIRSGRFEFRRTIDGVAPYSVVFNDAPKADFRLCLSGQDWVVARSQDTDTFIYGDVIVRRDGRLISLRRPLSPAHRAELQINSPDRVHPVNVLAAVRAGTLPSEAVARFVDEHRHDAQLAEGERTQDFRTTTRMEWKVAAADAGRVFDATSDLLSSGGVLRIDVADKDGYVLPLVEYVDRFGGVEARFLAGQFVDVAPGVVFPQRYHVSQDAEIQYDFHGIDLVNKEIPDVEFDISIPAGTHVRDFRLRKGPDGKLVEKAGPLMDFTLGSVYALPKEMLAAMDEGVLNEEESRKVLEVERPSAPAEPPAGQPQAVDERKDDFSYGGRSFAEWRHQLLNDLDEKTCVAAMPAIVAFGKKGYAEEAVAALSEVLHDDRDAVVAQAASSLSQLGAVSALADGLEDHRTGVRIRSVIAIQSLGVKAKAATEALLKLLDSEKEPRSPDEPSPRPFAIRALVGVAGNDKAVQSTLDAIVTSNATSDRRAIVESLQGVGRHFTGHMLRLALRLCEDDDVYIRRQAGYLLAVAGPPVKEVIEALKRLLRDLDQEVWVSAMQGLLQSNTDPMTSAIVLADGLRSADVREHMVSTGDATHAIEQFARAPEQATVSVPVLTDILDGKFEDLGVPGVNTAVEVLGKLGRAAKAAIPALERRVAGAAPAIEHPGTAVYNDFTPKLAERALRKIAGSADRSPNEEK